MVLGQWTRASGSERDQCTSCGPLGVLAGATVAELVDAVRKGNILYFAGWWNPPENAVVKAIYGEAGKK